MGEKEPVTGGSGVAVTFQDMEDSEYGGLLVARQKLFPTERREIMVSGWIQEEKSELLTRTGRAWSYFTSDTDLKRRAFTTIVHMVGIRVLRRAQNARIDITDTDYSRQIKDLDVKIDRWILNFQDPESDISVSNVEPDLVDPDEDYDYD